MDNLSTWRRINRKILQLQINELNHDPTIHGIIVQMPLDSVNAIDADVITDSVVPEKDVDGWVNYAID